MADVSDNASYASDASNLEHDAAAAFAELSRISLADNDLYQVLARVAELAKRCVPAAVDVSVTLLTDGLAGTVATTGELALALDEKQYEAGYGPCLDAARSSEVYLIRDTAVETRWPAFTAKALELGVRSSLSTTLPVHDSVHGALNVYSLQRDAFDDDAQGVLRTFAGYAAVALANAHLYSTTAALAEQMKEAMASRAVIEQAKGVLIAQRGVDPEEAFKILARASQVGNRKLRDIAQRIVDNTQNGHHGSPPS